MSACVQDAAFGPASSCRSFDFTLTFESAILSLLPTSCFLIASTLVLYNLRNSRRVLNQFRYLPAIGKQFCCWKIGIAVAALVFDAIALAAWVATNDSLYGKTITTAALAVRVVGSLISVPIVYLEFFNRLHASPLFSVFLSVYVLCDMVRIRTFAFIELQDHKFFFAGFAGAFACIGLSWLLETVPKGAFVERAEGDPVITDEETSSFWARVLITSVNPVLWKGFRTGLNIQSLGHIHSRYEAEKLYDAGYPQWERHLAKGGKHPLFRAMLSAFGMTLLAPVLPCILFSLAQITVPTLITDVINFIDSYQTGNPADREPVSHGYGLVGAYLLVFLISTFSWSLFQMSALRCSVAVRGFLVQMVYRKALRVHQDVAKEVGAGSATSLMSVDVERMVTQLEPFHLLYSSLVMVLVALVILYKTVGLAFIATIITAVAFLVSIPLTTRSIPKHQKAWSHRTDLRVKLVNSVIRNIKAVKLSGYEDILIRKLEYLRGLELDKQKTYYWRILGVALYTNCLRSLLQIATLVTYTIISQNSANKRVDTAIFFTAISVLTVITEPLLIVGQRYAGIMAATASLARIQAFLLKDEKHDARTQSDDIRGEKLSFGTKETVLLKDMSFALPKGDLTMILGSVGSGKSSFLYGLLGEVDSLKGELYFPKDASVGFCAQDAWLRPGDSVRQNITFMSSLNPALYRIVVKACALDVDFRIWPEGDSQKAQGLSGGQKARIALARALYARPDILVLDDVFSALDKATEEHIFQALFGMKGMLNGKTVIMATNAVHRLPRAKHILFIEDQTILQQGMYADLSENPGAIAELLKLVKAAPAIEAHNALMHNADDANSSFVASLAKSTDEIEAEMAAAQSKRRPFRVFATAGGFFSFLFLGAAGFAHSVVPGLIPVYVQAWTSAVQDDQGRMYSFLGGYVALEVLFTILLGFSLWYIFMIYGITASRRMHAKEIRAVLKTSLSYFDDKPIGRIISRFSQDLFVLDFEVSNYWGNFYSMAVEMLVTSVILSVVQPLLAPIIAATFILCLAVQRFYLRTSRQVRRMDFIAKSPMYTLFAETMDTDGLKTLRAARAEDQLSRMAIVKGNTSQVPYYTMNAVKKWLNLVLGLVVTVINCMLVLMAVLYREKTSSGLLAAALVQATSLVYGLNQVISSAAEFETALVAVSRIQEVIELPREEEEAVPLLGKTSSHGAQALISPGLDKKGADDYLSMHTLGKTKLQNWITAGSVRFSNVVLRYRPDLPPALKDLSFVVKGGQRLGLVGRSGCGKSSTLQALFRMVECESGQIAIDGIDIKSIPRSQLRHAMTIIPQDPLLLELSLRDNLDLDGECTDQQIWAALEQTRCKAIVEALPEKLDTMISGEGGDFSRGERQLLALTRALLRSRQLLVLDEASSSLDIETDALIQQVIRTAFRNRTVITVAHRLNTLLDYDQVLVLSAGQIVEQGNPQELLRNPDGAFSQLLRGEQSEAQGQSEDPVIQEL